MEGVSSKLMAAAAAVLVVIMFVGSATQAYGSYATCSYGPCKLQQLECPYECPELYPSDPKSKACYLDCYSPVCKPSCKNRKPNCNSPGAACLDPRFIGGDGIVFYFHGKTNENFALVSDPTFQINARFTGHRPVGRPRDFTWIQALGFVLGSTPTTTFSLEAAKSATWNNNIDHLKFTYNGADLAVPAGHLSTWQSPDDVITVQRTSDRNSVVVTIPEVGEVTVSVVPVTAEDDRVHGYKVPADDCFAHLEVQFKFSRGMSEKVEGVLGKTYRPDFRNPAAKPGVAMPVVGGEDVYRTSSLLAADCGACLFDPAAAGSGGDLVMVGENEVIDCSGRFGSGNGIVCRK
ncbi:unnamed protein product [Linum tenue]|uniref:Uncharacterized protein n=1 Tax=Linum tenue TaxID=586396 RepID=A0AAV0GT44_9ROSI|nr:unnamed protein product [Linum tenue]